MDKDSRFRFDAALIPGMRDRLRDAYMAFRAIEREHISAYAPSSRTGGSGPAYHERPCPCCETPPPTAVEQSANGIDIVVCPGCGLAYARAVMDQASDSLRYQASDLDDASLALRTSQPYLELEVARSEYYLDVLSAEGVREGSLLEIGCGTGTFGLTAQGRGLRVIGLDPGRSAIGIARRRGLEALEGYFPDDLPDQDQRFDVVALLDVLEHFERPKSILKIIQRYLAPGGRVFIQVPNYDSLLVNLEGSRSSIICPGHWSYFTPMTLATLMRAAGLRPMRIETVVTEMDRIAAFPDDQRARALAELRPGIHGDELTPSSLLNLQLGYKLIGVARTDAP